MNSSLAAPFLTLSPPAPDGVNEMIGWLRDAIGVEGFTMAVLPEKPQILIDE